MSRVVKKYFPVLALFVYACTFPVLEITHFHFLDVERSSVRESSIPHHRDSTEGKIPYRCPICVRIHSSFPALHVEKQNTQFVPICSVPIENTSIERGSTLAGFSQRAPPPSFS